MRSNFETANLPGPGGAEPAAAREISVTGRYATPRGVAVWILLAALCNAAGWILSGLHQLNLAGYVVFFALALACIAVGQRFNRRSGARLDEAYTTFHVCLARATVTVAKPSAETTPPNVWRKTTA